MEITIAGAGAGKTSSMSKKVIEIYQEIAPQKRIYCIAFTNNAVNCIKSRLVDHFGSIPDNIAVSTIHSFLYQEIVRPYYYLLFEKHYKRISVSTLPTEIRYKNATISRLEANNVIHQTVIPERAKWVVVKKSDDNADRKAKRKVVLKSLQEYIGAICIDEAQDIDNDITEIIKILETLSIRMVLMGDPKQDLKGYGNLRLLAQQYVDGVSYLSQCFRCPCEHLNISNFIVPDSEKQCSNVKNGIVNLIFESDEQCSNLISSNDFDLMYISQKNPGYETHSIGARDDALQSTYEELIPILQNKKPDFDENKINRWAYYNAQRLIEAYKRTGNKSSAITEILGYGFLNKSEFGKVINSISDETNEASQDSIRVSSIESIKGLV